MANYAGDAADAPGNSWVEVVTPENWQQIKDYVGPERWNAAVTGGYITADGRPGPTQLSARPSSGGEQLVGVVQGADGKWYYRGQTTANGEPMPYKGDVSAIVNDPQRGPMAPPYHAPKEDKLFWQIAPFLPAAMFAGGTLAAGAWGGAAGAGVTEGTLSSSISGGLPASGELGTSMTATGLEGVGAGGSAGGATLGGEGAAAGSAGTGGAAGGGVSGATTLGSGGGNALTGGVSGATTLGAAGSGVVGPAASVTGSTLAQTIATATKIPVWAADMIIRGGTAAIPALINMGFSAYALNRAEELWRESDTTNVAREQERYQSNVNLSHPTQVNATGDTSSWTQNPDGTWSQKQTFSPSTQHIYDTQQGIRTKNVDTAAQIDTSMYADPNAAFAQAGKDNPYQVPMGNLGKNPQTGAMPAPSAGGFHLQQLPQFQFGQSPYGAGPPLTQG